MSGRARGSRGGGGARAARAEENTAEQGAPRVGGTGREISVAGGKEDELEYKGRSAYDGGGEGAFSYF